MTCYKPAGPHIVYQNIAGEIIVVDLEAGSYFSLLGSAVLIWESLVNGLNREKTLRSLALNYNAAEAQIRAEVDGFINRLSEEGLIVVCAASTDLQTQPEGTAPREKVAFERPELHKYDDMADVLALDPVHDFDQAGWPNQATLAHEGTATAPSA